MGTFMIDDRFRVIIPMQAEVPHEFRPGGSREKLTRAALADIEPWDDPRGVIEHRTFRGMKFPVHVVPAQGHAVRWARHTMHTARHVQLSPFVRMEEVPTTETMTLELFRVPEKATLGRLYFNDNEVPPLPWQSSARNVEGGVKRCETFWKTHAYVYDRRLVCGGGVFEKLPVASPHWFRHIS